MFRNKQTKKAHCRADPRILKGGGGALMKMFLQPSGYHVGLLRGRLGFDSLALECPLDRLS